MPIQCPMRADILRHWMKSPRVTERSAAKVVMNSHAFNVQNIVDYVHKIVEVRGKYEVPIYDTLTLPFPVCHFEYKFPLYWLTNKRTDTETYDASVTMCQTENQDTLSCICALRGWQDKIPGIVCTVEIPTSGRDDNSPCTIGVEHGSLGHRMGRMCMGPKDTSPADVLKDVIGRMNIPVLYALNLLACKNVNQHVEERDTHSYHKANGGSKKEWVPTFDYRVINIPIINDVAKGRYDKYLSEHKNLPLHSVMGHFKTYTAERPLMGKHVGRWWWQPTLKGTEANGIIVKDYQFGEVPELK